MGNLTRIITHVRKCVINRNYTFSEKVRNMASEILVLLGNNTRVVKFTSGVVDVVMSEIRNAFSDVLQPGQEFFLKVKREEWGGVFVDVQKNDEIVDKSVVKAEMMKDCDRRNELVGFDFVTCL